MRRILPRVALAIICSACANVAAGTYPARPRVAHPPPLPEAPAANGLQTFKHQLPLPQSLTHDEIPLSDWHSEPPRPSLIDARPKRSLGEANYRPWAELLNEIHRRVHPVFADQYLVSLDRLPAASPLQDHSLYAQIELHIIQSTGELATIGVRRSSGIPEFDVAALIAFSKAFPLPIAPGLASLNGEVYVTWEVRRDRLACTTLHAHPFRLE